MATEEIEEIEIVNREKTDNKMKDPKCIKKRAIVKPHSYYEQNKLTIFAPQSKLTPE